MKRRVHESGDEDPKAPSLRLSLDNTNIDDAIYIHMCIYVCICQSLCNYSRYIYIHTRLRNAFFVCEGAERSPLKVSIIQRSRA